MFVKCPLIFHVAIWMLFGICGLLAFEILSDLLRLLNKGSALGELIAQCAAVVFLFGGLGYGLSY